MRVLDCTQIACQKNSPHHGHICVADEHYVASLLSAYKMRDTFDRVGMFTFVDWKSVGGWHPKTFYPGDSLQSLYAMRSRSGPPGCGLVDDLQHVVVLLLLLCWVRLRHLSYRCL